LGAGRGQFYYGKFYEFFYKKNWKISKKLNHIVYGYSYLPKSPYHHHHHTIWSSLNEHQESFQDQFLIKNKPIQNNAEKGAIKKFK
jgi:hypothetical protein